MDRLLRSIKFLFIFGIFLSFQSQFKVSGAKILAIFQDPSYSHELTFHKILKALADRGHYLTIFGAHTFDYQNNPNVTQHVFKDSVENYKKNFNVTYVEQTKTTWMRLLLQYEVQTFYELTRTQIGHPEMQKIIKNHDKKYKFDVIIMEYYFYNLALLAEIYDCPIIAFAASEPAIANHGLMGNDVNPAIYSDATRFPYLHGQLSFSERVSSVAYYFTYYAIFVGIVYKYYVNQIASEYPINGTTKDPLDVLNDRLALLVANTSPEFGHVRALSPYTIQIGFFHVEDPKELTNFEVKEYLDASINGVIVMSFGSKIKTADLGIKNVEKFLKAFNQTSYDILWKFDEIIDPEKVPKNVKLTNWMPLSDVLAHPNVKIIIHHGGLLTSYEAIVREVPQIIFPLVYDEGANAKLLVKKGVAIELNINTFEETMLTGAIDKVVSSDFRENIRVLRYNVNDQIIDRKELAVFHIEKVIRHKNEKIYKFKLNPFASFFHRHLLDIFTSTAVVIGTVYFIVKNIRK
ncbi:hypothetical protein ACKWTF_014434 [Chironomus riparius]